MLFNSWEYAGFFALIFAAFWALRKKHVARTILLVVASCWFYTRFDYGKSHPHLGWIYLGVLAASATIDFFLARAIHESESQRRRKAMMLVSVVYNLGVLAYFKYTNFAIDAAVGLLGSLHVHLHPRTLSLVLPIGISFFTFETMSYTIDVYRRELVPAKSFLEYLLFISFFPHLVEGPIIRPKDMLPQLRADPQLDAARGSEGLFLIVCGLLKKVVIADYLAINHVDRVFDRVTWFSAPEVLAGVYAYALQIYCDFSGYTDIALGSALLLGYVLPKNFDSPYQSTSLQEFWRRWHISLSSWLRDYLYIPLGGSRGAPWRTYLNLMITMVLGGLWHGASWNFVVWGALHGGALGVNRVFTRWRAKRRGLAEHELPKGSFPVRVLAGVVTFHYVCFAWIFFRAKTFAEARAVLSQIVHGDWHVTNLSRWVVLVMLTGLVTHLIPDPTFRRLREGFVRLPALAQGAVLFGAALLIHEAASSAVVPFLYFQF